MNLRTEKLNLIHQIIKIEDEMMIQTIKDLLTLGYIEANNDTDFWDELSESQKQSIALSIKQLEAGEGIPHDQVMADMRKMLAK
jgi:hypothetical protein